MHIVFAHHSFPAQFGAFGHWLSKQGWRVTFLTADTDATPPKGTEMVHATGPAAQPRSLSSRPFRCATTTP